MKVAISSLSPREDSLISKIKKILDDENIDSEIIKRSDKMTTFKCGYRDYCRWR